MKTLLFLLFLIISSISISQYQLYGLSFDEIHNHLSNQKNSTFNVSESGKSKIILQDSKTRMNSYIFDKNLKCELILIYPKDGYLTSSIFFFDTESDFEKVEDGLWLTTVRGTILTIQYYEKEDLKGFMVKKL